MAWVALEFENDRILVATARAAGKRIQVQHLLTVDIQGADGSVAEQLKAALSEQGGGRGEALVVVNRTSTEVRLLDVPPDNVEPGRLVLDAPDREQKEQDSAESHQLEQSSSGESA